MFNTIKDHYNEMCIGAYGYMSAIKQRGINFERNAREHIKSGNKAQGILEYGLIIALVSVAVIFAVTKLKDQIVGKLEEASTTIQNAKGN